MPDKTNIALPKMQYSHNMFFKTYIDQDPRSKIQHLWHDILISHDAETITPTGFLQFQCRALQNSSHLFINMGYISIKLYQMDHITS